MSTNFPMKILLLTSFFIFSSNSIIFSQIINSYGVKLGYVHSTQDYSIKDIDNVINWKSGFSVSAFVDLFNFSSFSLSPEIMYIQKGATMDFITTGPEGPEPNGKITQHVFHNFLSIPISIKYTVAQTFGNLFFKAAPRYDILLKSYDDFEYSAADYSDYENVFGGSFSIGFEPNINFSINPFVELSYHLDFVNTFSNEFLEIKNRAIEINIGILL